MNISEYVESLKFLSEKEKVIILEDLYRNKNYCKNEDEIKLMCIKYLITYYGERHKKHIIFLLLPQHIQSIKKALGKMELIREIDEENLVSIVYQIYKKIPENKIIFVRNVVDYELKMYFINYRTIPSKNETREIQIPKEEKKANYKKALEKKFPQIEKENLMRIWSIFSNKEQAEILLLKTNRQILLEFEAISIILRKSEIVNGTNNSNEMADTLKRYKTQGELFYQTQKGLYQLFPSVNRQIIWQVLNELKEFNPDMFLVIEKKHGPFLFHSLEISESEEKTYEQAINIVTLRLQEIAEKLSEKSRKNS